MTLILSEPPFTPGRDVAQWDSMSVEWIDAFGNVWDLANGIGGVFLQRTGTEGLHNPIITKYSSKSRAVPGNRNRGWRAEERPVFWPVLVYSDEGSRAWRDVYRAFFRSIHPKNEGTWRVGYAGESRELRLTGVYRDGAEFGTDPLALGYQMFGIPLEAAQPYWTGTPVVRGPWSAPAPMPFFDAAGSPPFHISEATSFGNAAVDNPGDVDAYPVWTVQGPLTSVRLGVESLVIEVPFQVAAGETLTVDTDPRNVTATLNGLDVTPALGFQPFAAIPAGERVPVQVSATGAGSVTCTLTPLYFRAL